MEFGFAQLHRDELAALTSAMISHMVGVALDDVVLDENPGSRERDHAGTMEPEDK